MKQYDVLVIGAGPGGYVAAIRAAQLGATVAVVEKEELGGTCLTKGCIPTKALVSSTDLINRIKNSSKFGINISDYSVDFQQVITRKNEIVGRLVNGIGFLFKKYKINLIKGQGEVLSSNIVEIRKKEGVEHIAAKNIIIATGSKPLIFPEFNYDGKKVITSNEALELKEAPQSLLIIGAGVIGCEFANIFSALGSKITMVDTAPDILATEGKTISGKMEKIFTSQGIKIRTGETIKKIEVKADEIVAYTDNNEKIVAEKALISIGRKIVLNELGLDKLGIIRDQKGGIMVNDRMETNVKGIYAVGDVTNKVQLAHVASTQGKVAVENIMGKDVVMNYDVIPSCIFTNPEIASVGIDKFQAVEQGYEVLKGSFSYNKNGKSMAMGIKDGIVDLIIDKNTDRILGAQIIGEHASDIISEVSVAMTNNLTGRQLANTIHPHPTLSEILMEAAESVYGMATHN